MKQKFKETIVFTSGFLKGRELTATTTSPRTVGFKSDCPLGTSQYEVVKVIPIIPGLNGAGVPHNIN